MSSLPKRILTDMRVLVATPLALIVALLFVGTTAWAVSTFPQEVERPVVAQAPPLTTEQRTELERWWNLQPAKENFPYSNEGAKVLIVEFADFQCPHCKQNYFAYKPILDKYLASRPKDVKFVFKTWPLNTNCNASVPSAGFTASCDASAAYVLAKSKGTADKLKDWFFTHQEELSPATVRRAAVDIGGLNDLEAQTPKALQEVKTDAAIGSALGVISTPSFFVNGKRIPEGGVPPQYFDAIIELELKRTK